MAGERLRYWQGQELDDNDRNALADIAETGWHVIHVLAEGCMPGFTYSIGIYDTFGQPEALVLNLEPDTGIAVVNGYGELLREGQPVKLGERVEGLLDRVHCELHVADSRWPRMHMYWDNWFYDSWDFPVVQCVYPDLDNRFPWEPGFDESWRPRQPLLFPPHDTEVEREYWKQLQRDEDKSSWPFPNSRHKLVFTVPKVIDVEEPVTYVCHDASDGAWQFLGDSELPEQPSLVCMHWIVDADPTIKEVADLPPGWRAWRDQPGLPWQREPKTEEE